MLNLHFWLACLTFFHFGTEHEGRGCPLTFISYNLCFCDGFRVKSCPVLCKFQVPSKLFDVHTQSGRRKQKKENPAELSKVRKFVIPIYNMTSVLKKDMFFSPESPPLYSTIRDTSKSDFLDHNDPSHSTPLWLLPFPPRFTLVYNPLLALVFVSVYWVIGLLHAYFV